MIERSGARTRLGELLVIWLIGSLTLLLLAWVLAGLLGVFIGLIVLCLMPPAALQAAVDRRAKLFASQLPDVLKLTASSLRAGFSLLQGLEAVTKQLREPSAGELQRVLAEARLGRPSRRPSKERRPAYATATSRRVWPRCVSSRKQEAI